MINVLHVISGLGDGGAERMLAATAIGLKQRGFVQHVASLRGRGRYADEIESAGIPVSGFDVGSMMQGLSALRALKKMVSRIRPDIIQGWMYHGDLAAALLHRFSFGRSRRALCWNIRASNMDERRYARLISACGWLSGWPDVVVADSEAGARVHAGRGYHARRIVIIPNGIDTELFRPDPAARAQVRGELGLGERIVAIHVARVDPMKDHETFLAAMAGLPDISGLMVGAGTENLACPPNVRALGAQKNIERFYAAADLVVLSSAFGEGFPNALAEGMSAGLVPIATDVGDAARIVGPTGKIVAPRDAVALAAAIKAEAGSSRNQRWDRGLSARARIIASFGREQAVDAYVRLYRECVAAKTR